MQHEAIYALYKNVVTIRGVGDDAVATDKDGKTVAWDASNVKAKEAELLDAHKLDELRAERNSLLAQTDYLALSDQTLSNDMATYRQKLRDITKTYSNVSDVVWPTKPS